MRWLALLLAAACGRVYFDPIGGASSDATSNDVPAGSSVQLVSSSSFSHVMGSSYLFPFHTTSQPGTLLAIAIANEDGPTATVTSITSNDGTPLLATNARAINTTCNKAIESFYLPANPGGLTSITVVMSIDAGAEAWIVEVRGVSQLDTTAIASNQAATATPTTVVATTGNDFVLSTLMSCTAVTGLAAGNPFTAFPIESGEAAAYDITATAGNYGATWTYGGGIWNASTIAFH